MSEQLPPLEPDVAELLDAEKVIAPVSPDEKARALGVVLARLGLVGPGGGGGGGAPTNGGPAGLVSSIVHAHPWLFALGTFALGAASGAALYASLAGERVVYVAQAPLPPSMATASEAAPEAQPSPSPPATSPPATGVAAAIPAPRVEEQKERASRSPAQPSGDTLAAERAIIDVARRAVGSGDGALAMEAVDRHERQFPSGLLEEEREAMAIKALVLLGRKGDARSRAARFQARYPRSLLASAVERALASIPDAATSENGAF